VVAWSESPSTDAVESTVMTRLEPSEQRRLAAMDPAAASRFVQSRDLLIRTVDRVVGHSDATLVARCDHCGGDHGRIHVIGAPVSVSVSYAGPVAIVAVLPDDAGAAVGIDIEEATAPAGRMHELAALFAPDDPPDLATWTRIEAVLKADGRGLRVPPNRVRFAEEGGERMLPGLLATLPGTDDRFEVATVDALSGYVVSVAVAARSTVAG
jgi:4'-phosphopantetheinyl transferase